MANKEKASNELTDRQACTDTYSIMLNTVSDEQMESVFIRHSNCLGRKQESTDRERRSSKKI